MLSYGALLLALISASSCWNDPSSNQYHIQTDEGPERYFRYQTDSGQYRKEKRLDDGTVVGTYAWIDDAGILRQRDYIADNAGYRILKTKNLYVGRNTPINVAIKSAKKVPAAAGTLVKQENSVPSSTAKPYEPQSLYLPVTTPSPEDTNSLTNLYVPENNVQNNPSWYNSPKPSERFQNGPTYPIDTNGNMFTGTNKIGNGYDPQYPLWDGVSVTNDGFRYYIPRAYHEEQTSIDDKKTGSFGYIDPFGIRRVIYYNTGPGTGFQHKKNNRYVGFNATPYDPRPYAK